MQTSALSFRPFAQLRHVLRKLARSPLFATVSILTLALGIGANTAVFTVVHSVLLEPLPFQEPERLVGMWHEAPGLGFEIVNQSPATYFTYREQGKTFTDVGMWDNTQVSITGLERPEQVDAMMVSDGTLPLLGIQPALGRRFTAEDDSPGTPETVILAHGFWQSHFGGDPETLGRTLQVDGRPREIIGILPADFRFLSFDTALYLPFRFVREEVTMGNFSYQGLARLAPGATLEQANADVERMIPLAVEQFPVGISLDMLKEARFAPKVRPLKIDAVGDVGPALWVLLGTVGIVLLIACANVANLFLVRAEDRQMEVAVRTALGASRGAVIWEFLSESLVLGVLGGLAGLGLAAAGLKALVAIGPESLPRLHEIEIDSTVLAFTVGISLLAALLFGLIPALRRSATHLVTALKEGGRTSDGRERLRARNVLVVAQIALALVLLVASGLMFRSFGALRQVDPGFDAPEEVLTLRVAIPEAEIEDPLAAAGAHERILENIRQIPGVVAAGMSSSITMDRWDNNDALYVEDFPTPEGQLPPIRRFKWISPEYFATMGNPLLAGRGISWDDIHQLRPVAVVTENFAREYWESPAAALGKRVRNSFPEADWREIVGVVGNVHDNGVSEESEAVIYWPMVNANFWDEEIQTQRSMAYAIRSVRAGNASLLDDARRAVWSVSPNLPLANVRTLQELLDRSTARTSFTLVMLGIAAAVALLLGIIGIYGVISYTVSMRTREIGVRLALGAEQRNVRGMVLGQAFRLAAVGIVVGLATAVGLTRLMSSLLFGVRAIDPLTYAAVATALMAVALLASYLPAARAASTDPMVALRWE